MEVETESNENESIASPIEEKLMEDSIVNSEGSETPKKTNDNPKLPSDKAELVEAKVVETKGEPHENESSASPIEAKTMEGSIEYTTLDETNDNSKLPSDQVELVEETVIETKGEPHENESNTSPIKVKPMKDSIVNSEDKETRKETNDNPNLPSDNVELVEEKVIETKGEPQSQYDPKHVHYEGDLAVYTDPASGYQYQWNKVDEKWEPKQQVQYGFEDDTHTYTDGDGTKFFWDKTKSAWFPKLNDDFMAQYQMNYGFIDNTTKEEEKPKPELPEKPKIQQPKGEKRKPSEPTWFDLDDELNTKVYVSNLPLDLTEEEFVDFMQKCGLIMRDPITHNMKIKMYKEPNSDLFKGDALCTYIRVESVELALKLLDGSDIRNKKVKIERAKFQQKGTYDPKLKPKTKKRKDKQKLKRMQEKLFDWRPEKVIGERAKHEKVVIIRNLFDPKLFDDEVGLILEYQQDLREEASKCGEVRRVALYDRHPEGVAQINMKEPEEADQVVTLLNGRWFGKRQLTAEIWDGKTKFKIAETDSEISKRLDNWDKFLEDEEEGKKKEEARKKDEQLMDTNQDDKTKAAESAIENNIESDTK